MVLIVEMVIDAEQGVRIDAEQEVKIDAGVEMVRAFLYRRL